MTLAAPSALPIDPPAPATAELVTVAELHARRDALLTRAGMGAEALAELAADYLLTPELQQIAAEVDGIDWLLHG